MSIRDRLFWEEQAVKEGVPIQRASDLDEAIDELVRKHGVKDVLAALCRQCHDMGMPVLFRKLNRVYEWLVD